MGKWTGSGQYMINGGAQHNSSGSNGKQTCNQRADCGRVAWRWIEVAKLLYVYIHTRNNTATTAAVNLATLNTEKQHRDQQCRRVLLS